MSPYGIPFYYPMRDGLKKELISHANMTMPPLSELVDREAFASTQAPPSGRNTTIDVLMKQYFESVEESYPSIVSNVVRTTGKLHVPPLGHHSQKCKLCLLPVDQGNFGIHGWGGDQATDQENDEDDGGLCYGCARSAPVEVMGFLP